MLVSHRSVGAAPPVEISDPNEDWNRFFLLFTVSEDAVWMNENRKKSINALTYLLDLAPEGFEIEHDEED
jgi:hypothetical protein